MIFIVLSICLVSCKETQCPAFPNALIDYYPYSSGEIIKFHNFNNDTVYLKIVDQWQSDNYSFGWNCKCSCSAYSGFKSEIDSKNLIGIYGTIEVSNETKLSIISCDVYNGKISNDNFEYRIDEIDAFLEENQKIFGDTVIIEKADYYRYNKIIIVKGKGIVKFWDTKENCTWIII